MLVLVDRSDNARGNDTGESVRRNEAVLGHDAQAGLSSSLAGQVEYGISSAECACTDSTQSLFSSESCAIGGDPAPTFPVPGWERYTSPRHLGHGGMGIVFAVTDPRLGREVAIKFVRGDNPDHARRLIIEARAQARVRHASICEIHEVGEVDGKIYIAMQYVAGKPLGQLVAELSTEQVAILIRGAALGLHEAHRVGIIHRDVKPSNILIERSPGGELRPYVVDFGLARAAQDDGVTQTGAVLGTPHYMAPEQASGLSASVDRRADVYGLGATLYCLLAGRPPIAGDNPLEVMTHLMTGDFPSLRALVPGVPPDLEAIIVKCLERDRARRYDSARALADDLGRFLDGEPVSARSVGVWYRLSKRLTKHRRLLVAVTAALVAALAITGWARARRKVETMIAGQVRAATTAFDTAGRIADHRARVRAEAFRLFDGQRWSDGETLWNQVEELGVREAGQLLAASNYLEAALALDPTRTSLRAQFADLTYARLLRAELDHQHDLADELAGRLSAYDDGSRRAALHAGSRVEFDIIPAGTQVWSERPGVAPQLLGEAPLPALTMASGSVILSFEAPGRVPARLPLLLVRGETLRQRVALPRADSAPAGMIYVPGGRFLFGSADGNDSRRGFLTAAPMHEVTTGNYYIGRHEVTFGEWIAFLDDLALEERIRRTPHAVSSESSLELIEITPRRWRLALTPWTRTYVAEMGQRLHYEHRTRRVEQDWTRFPVAGVSYQDVVTYAAWLDRTKRIPGARLCDEYEWERAARGADARMYPGGDKLALDDANIDGTDRSDPLSFGPDEVGLHPASRSPVGADDMAGNVWEWTRSVETREAAVVRGGGWFHNNINARSMNREAVEPTLRYTYLGARICATPVAR